MKKKRLCHPGIFKIIIVIQLIILNISVAAGQDAFYEVFMNKEKLADKYYLESNISEALNIYLKIAGKQPQNKNITLKIANCHYKLNHYKKAFELYASIEEYKQLFTEESSTYYYMTMSNLGYHEKAAKWYNLPDKNAICDYYKDSARYRIKKLKINSENNDYAPFFYKTGIIFISSRSNNNIIKRIDALTNCPLDEIFFSRIGEDGQLLEPVNFSNKINHQNKYNFGPAAFYQSDKKMVFSQNEKIIQDNGKNIKLWLAESQAFDKWHVIKKIDLKIKGSVSHPFVDEKNNHLYFVTDGLNGFGGTDIYVCNLNGDTNSIRNLGPEINTPGNEMFPYIHDDHLYFASNGHFGMGGLDIYKSKIRNGNFTTVTNLGYPVNSSMDDFSIVFEKFGKTGFFSSNRENYSDDLYQFFIQ